MKKYQIIYADPPWKYDSKELQTYKGERFTSMDKHYITQRKDWIKRLLVKDITSDDCALFMWATDSHIPEALEVMKAWGFKYVTVAFVWEKKTAKGKTVANLGAWTMKNYEICLLGTKGRMLKYKKVNNIYQKIEAIRTVHSKKPSQARKRIELLFGNLDRIELFAREKHTGWDSWGNEVENSIILNSI